MKYLIPTCLAVAAATFAAPVLADANLDLAKSKQCTGCHAPEQDTLAPSFKNIAAKYRDRPNAADALVATVLKGSKDQGGNHWGTMKMPSVGARVELSQAEAKQLVAWILAQP